MIERSILLKYKFDKGYNIIGDFDLFIKLSTFYKIDVFKIRLLLIGFMMKICQKRKITYIF